MLFRHFPAFFVQIWGFCQVDTASTFQPNHKSAIDTVCLLKQTGNQYWHGVIFLVFLDQI